LFKDATGITPYILNNNAVNVRTFISKDPSINFSQAFNDMNPGQHTVLIAAISPSPAAALLDPPQVPSAALLATTNVYSYSLAAVITGDAHPEQYTNKLVTEPSVDKTIKNRGENSDESAIKDSIKTILPMKEDISAVKSSKAGANLQDIGGILDATIGDNNNFEVPESTESNTTNVNVEINNEISIPNASNQFEDEENDRAR
jgi:hypothetical protein